MARNNPQRSGLARFSCGVILSVMGLWFVNVSLADNFDDYLAEANAMSGQGQQALNGVDPATIPGYTANPSQSQYDQGVTQPDADMSDDANVAEEANPATATVANNALTRPRYAVNVNAPAIANAKYIQTNANAIVTGDTSTGVVCTDGQGQTVPTESKQCVKSQEIDLNCTDRLVATVTYPDLPFACEHIVIEAERSGVNPQPPPNSHLINRYQLSSLTYAYYVFGVAGPDSELSCYFPGSFVAALRDETPQANFTPIVGAVQHLWGQAEPSGETGAAITVTRQGKTVAAINANAPFTQEKAIPAASQSVTDHIQLANTGPNGEYTGVAFAWVTTPKTPPPVVTTQWVSDCGNFSDLIQSDACVAKGSTCTDGPATKTIDGVPVTEDCWSRTSTFHCGQADDGSCDALFAAGCSQADSQCLTFESGMCLAYQETFYCPLEPVNGYRVVCGTSTRCEGDNCAPAANDQNQEFDQAAAGLATVNAEGEAVYTNQDPVTWEGEVMGCENDGVGFSNCCRKSGWGQDIHLAHCSDEEKKLGHAREQGLTTFVGTRCEKKNKFGCYLYKKMYCVWPSLLSRDVQEQGRRDQLHIGFGDADQPDCSGISVEQIQQINFDLIDFSNAYAEIEANTDLPDTAETQAQVENEAEQMANGGGK